jgi:hypothetical protein
MLDANGFLCKLPTINEGPVGRETATDAVATAIATENPMLAEVDAVFVSEILAVSRDSCGLRSPRVNHSRNMWHGRQQCRACRLQRVIITLHHDLKHVRLQ